MTKSSPLFQVSDLTVHYPGQAAPALTDLSMTVEAGQCLAVIGRSGAGKSSLLHTLTGLSPVPQSLVAGHIQHLGQDWLTAADYRERPGSGAHKTWLANYERQLKRARGPGIFTIFQEPRAALNPYRTLRAHFQDALSKSGRSESPEECLRRVDIGESFLSGRPSTLSVGMCQRVQIALALALGSRIVLADEPLARIDPRGRGLVLDLLKQLLSEGAAVILVTHDPELVTRQADQVLALHGGRVMEQGPKSAVFDDSAEHHPLLMAYRFAHRSLREQGRAWTPGTSTLAEQSGACPFLKDCWAAEADCQNGPVDWLSHGSAGRHCRRTDLSWGLMESLGQSQEMTRRDAGDNVLEATQLSREFQLRAGWFARQTVVAADQVFLNLRRGEIHALIGESGGGKSTVASLLVGLYAPSSGQVKDCVAGDTMPLLGQSQRLARTHRLQLVFQEADQALNPSWTVLDSVAEAYPMNVRGVSLAEARQLATALLASLALDRALMLRQSWQLSGGERKRAALARALAALGWGLQVEHGEPRVLILDEPLSGLDPVIQSLTLGVLLRAREQLSLSLLLISHDLGMAQSLADRLTVMYGGRVVERAARGQAFHHPFSQSLLDPWSRVEVSVAEQAAGCLYFEACHRPERGRDCGPQEVLRRADGSEVACWCV